MIAGSEAGEVCWSVAEPVPECSPEQAPSSGALLPGQHGRRPMRTSSQVGLARPALATHVQKWSSGMSRPSCAIGYQCKSLLC